MQGSGSGGRRIRRGGFAALGAVLVAASMYFTAPPSSATGIADVGVAVTGPTKVVPGASYSNTVTLSNSGLILALTSDIAYDVSGGSTITSVSDTACTFTSTTMACHYTNLGSGQSKTITVGLAAPGTGGLNADGYANVAQHAHESSLFDNLASDTNGGNDDSTLTTQVYTSDLGVALSADEPAVTNGLDQGVHWSGQNYGTRKQASVSWILNTGGVVDNDANNPLPAGCAVTGTTNQTVTCNQTNVATGGTFSAYVLVTTPATGSSMTTSASKTQSVAEFGGSTSNDTATLITPLSTSTPCGYNCMQAVVKQGKSITWASPSGDITQKFTVPANANWTGGAVKVTLKRITATFTCGGQPCYAGVPEVQAIPLNATSTPDPASPLQSQIDYMYNQVCGGNGGPAGCHKQYFLATGVYTGDAQLNPNCPTYGTSSFNTGIYNNCVQLVTKINNNQARILSLFLRDITLPQLGK